MAKSYETWVLEHTNASATNGTNAEAIKGMGGVKIGWEAWRKMRGIGGKRLAMHEVRLAMHQSMVGLPVHVESRLRVCGAAWVAAQRQGVRRVGGCAAQCCIAAVSMPGRPFCGGPYSDTMLRLWMPAAPQNRGRAPGRAWQPRGSRCLV